MYCDELELLVPSRAVSAGTLFALGAKRIIMTKQAVLGPIDPNFFIPLENANQTNNLPSQVSVEALSGFFEFAKSDLSLYNKDNLTSLLVECAKQVNPLIIGQISRSRTQIRALAESLLNEHLDDKATKNRIIEFLCSDSGSHDYTLNRREVANLGLNVEKPSPEFYEIIRKIKQDYSAEMELSVPFNPLMMENFIGQERNYLRSIIESVNSISYGFVTFGRAERDISDKTQKRIQFIPTFEGWLPLSKDNSV